MSKSQRITLLTFGRVAADGLIYNETQTEASSYGPLLVERAGDGGLTFFDRIGDVALSKTSQELTAEVVVTDPAFAEADLSFLPYGRGRNEGGVVYNYVVSGVVARKL